MDKEVLVWIEFAKTDLGVAKHLLEAYYPKPLEIICYHAQQTAEKAIKALVIFHGAQGGLPKNHNLSFLLEQIKNMKEIPEEYYDYADTLTPYGIVVRYPNELNLEETHAVKAIECAEKILAWVEGIVNKDCLPKQ